MAKSLQKRRVMRRRRLDQERKLREQMERGRPDRSWRQCNDPSCRKQKCRYCDIPFMVVTLSTLDNGGQTTRRTGLFLDIMVKHLWGGQLDEPNRLSQRDLVESFVWSPPVRGALGQFLKMSSIKNWNTSPDKMASYLAKIRKMVVYVVSTTRLDTAPRDVHPFFDRPFPNTWTVQHITLQFCVFAESWRRYGLDMGVEWTFGSDEAVADLHCAVLLNYVMMHQEGGVAVDRQGIWNIRDIWDQWLDRWHPMGVDTDEGGYENEAVRKTVDGDYDGGCYLEGFGQADVPWTSEQMRRKATSAEGFM